MDSRTDEEIIEVARQAVPSYLSATHVQRNVDDDGTEVILVSFTAYTPIGPKVTLVSVEGDTAVIIAQQG